MKLRAVVRVHPPQGKGQGRADCCPSASDRFLTLARQGSGLRPARVNSGHVQRGAELPEAESAECDTRSISVKPGTWTSP